MIELFAILAPVIPFALIFVGLSTLKTTQFDQSRERLGYYFEDDKDEE